MLFLVFGPPLLGYREVNSALLLGRADIQFNAWEIESTWSVMLKFVEAIAARP
jgi:hypothetical protein